MPRAEKTAFDRGELNKMSRQEIQQLAKQLGIKANGKTEWMREELLKKQNSVAPAQVVPQAAAGTRNRGARRRQPKEETLAQPEPTRRATRRRRDASGIPDSATESGTRAATSSGATYSQQVNTPEAAIVAGPSKASARSPTSHQRIYVSEGPSSVSLGGPAVAQQAEGLRTVPSLASSTDQADSEQVGMSEAETTSAHIPAPSPTTAHPLWISMQGAADARSTSPASSTVPPNLQQVHSPASAPQSAAPQSSQTRTHTIQDVREIRRRIASLIDKQAELRGEIDEYSILLDPTADRLLDCEQILQALSWRREAIEQTVLVQFKAHKQLWDGTHRPVGEDERGSAWQLHGSFQIPPHEFLEFLSDDDADSQTSMTGEAALSQAGSNEHSANEMEVGPPPLQAMDDGDDDMDDFYL